MTCREAMQTEFDFCLGEERLSDALEIMSATGGDLVPVVESRDGMRWMGMVGAREAAVRLGLSDQRPSEVLCRELAAPPPAQAAPGEDATVARERMRRAGMSSLPVIDGGKLVGMLAKN